MAVGAEWPRFSWRFRDTPRNFRQENYRIQVAEDRAFHRLVWDSGIVESGQSHLVEYRGPALKECTPYWFRVSAAGKGVRTAGWCEPEWFETAPREWRSAFIAMEDRGLGSSSAVRTARKGFDLPFVAARARLYATALGVYQILLNGQPISDSILAPGWTSYDKRLAFQTYDVTGLLVPGMNEIRCLVAPGWYKGCLGWRSQRNLYGKRLAFSCSMDVEGRDREGLSIETDSEWEVAGSPWLEAELYHGEVYDARRVGTEKWQKAVVLPSPASAIVPQTGPSVRPQEELHGKRISTPDGSMVYDFGQNISGLVRFNASGPGGGRIVIRHSEILDRHGNPFFRNLRSAKQRIDYTLAGDGPETYSPRFCTMGFRYIQIVEGGEYIDPENLVALVYHSELETGMEFSCSHEGLSRLHEAILRGWRGNSVDIPTDCPQRDERLGWTGDAQVFSATALRLTNAGPFLAKWLADLRADQLPNGAVPLVVPDVLSRFRQPRNEPVLGPPHTAAGWSDAATVVPWEVFRATGDLALLEASFGSMRAWVDRVREIAGEGLIWNQSPQLGDWLALDAKAGSFFGATPPELVATAYFARSARIVADAAGVLGKTNVAERYKTLHARIVKAFQGEFITSTGRVAAPTQTAHALVLAFGLCRQRDRQRIGRDLATLVRSNGTRLSTGFLGTPVLCDALSDSGQLEAAYALLLGTEYPSWLYPLGQGATTIWEHWDGMKPDGSMWNAKMNSFNHYAYGAVGDWIYRTIGGISLDPEEPAYRRSILQPRPCQGISSCHHKVETPYGALSLDWEVKEGVLHVNAQVPPNTQARLVLPGTERILGSGLWEDESPWPQF
jgi:alpha-L-rhamnosidase